MFHVTWDANPPPNAQPGRAPIEAVPPPINASAARERFDLLRKLFEVDFAAACPPHVAQPREGAFFDVSDLRLARPVDAVDQAIGEAVTVWDDLDTSFGLHPTRKRCKRAIGWEGARFARLPEGFNLNVPYSEDARKAVATKAKKIATEDASLSDMLLTDHDVYRKSLEHLFSSVPFVETADRKLNALAEAHHLNCVLLKRTLDGNHEFSGGSSSYLPLPPLHEKSPTPPAADPTTAAGTAQNTTATSSAGAASLSTVPAAAAAAAAAAAVAPLASNASASSAPAAVAGAAAAPAFAKVDPRDTILTVHIYSMTSHPAKDNAAQAHPKAKLTDKTKAKDWQKTHVFEVLGSQPLTALRDKLGCFNDTVGFPASRDLCFLCVQGTLFVDQRHQTHAPAVQHLKQWLENYPTAPAPKREPIVPEVPAAPATPAATPPAPPTATRAATRAAKRARRGQKGEGDSVEEAPTRRHTRRRTPTTSSSTEHDAEPYFEPPHKVGVQAAAAAAAAAAAMAGLQLLSDGVPDSSPGASAAGDGAAGAAGGELVGASTTASASTTTNSSTTTTTTTSSSSSSSSSSSATTTTDKPASGGSSGKSGGRAGRRRAPCYSKRRCEDMFGVSAVDVRSMADTTFDQLQVRIGERYMLAHQGNCHHYMFFVDVREVHAGTDDTRRAVYPRLLQRRGDHVRHKCDVCMNHWAKHFCFEEGSDVNTLFCERCYKSYHLDDDDKLLPEFDRPEYKRLPFFDH